MKYSEIIKAHGLYLCGLSLSKVALRFGVTRQRLHYYFKRVGLETRPLKRLEQISFNNNTYAKSSRGYWRKTNGDRSLLHRDVWEFNNGEIPEGYEVHHIDENKDNNLLSNLQLLRKDEHTKLHGFKNNQYTIKNKEKYSYKGVICNQCGKTWLRSDSDYISKRKFCNPKCKGMFLKNKPRGTKVEILFLF